MTFIMNVIHDEFSLLVADKKANMQGPTTITVGNMTINMPNGGTLIGYDKTLINSTRTFALGIAGDAMQHKYLNDLANINTANEAMQIIEKYLIVA